MMQVEIRFLALPSAASCTSVAPHAQGLMAGAKQRMMETEATITSNSIST